MFFFCKQKSAYEMRISDWSSDVCSSDLPSQRYSVPATAGVASSRQAAIVNRPLTHFIARSVTLLFLLAKSLIGKRDRRPWQDVTDYPLSRPNTLPTGPVGWVERSGFQQRSWSRSEERRVGKECVSTRRSRRSPHP